MNVKFPLGLICAGLWVSVVALCSAQNTTIGFRGICCFVEPKEFPVVPVYARFSALGETQSRRMMPLR
jgi:hypothetical protein